MVCLVPVLRGCIWYFCSVLAINERRDMGLYEVPLSMSLMGFGVGDYVSQFPFVSYYVVGAV